MIAVDTNLLVYAHRRESPWHQSASQCILELAEGGAAWAIPWPCVHEFLAVVTNPRAFVTPSPMAIARRQVDLWLGSPRLRLLAETPVHWTILGGLLERGRLVAGAVHDARIAALCLEHQVAELWTADRDFHRIPSLRCRNPLLAP